MIVRKLLISLGLFGILAILYLVLPVEDWMVSIGSAIGRKAYSVELDNFLAGFGDGADTNVYSASFLWVYLIALVTMMAYYFLIDSVRQASTGSWFAYVGGAGLVGLVVGFIYLLQRKGEVAALAGVPFAQFAIWGITLLVTTILLAIAFSAVLRLGAVNTRLTPFGR